MSECVVEDYPGIWDGVDARRGERSLRHCKLPHGMSLMHPAPKQMVMEGILVYAIVLGYDAEKLGKFYFAQRYLAGPTDAVQMGWAVKEFSRHLEQGGIRV